MRLRPAAKAAVVSHLIDGRLRPLTAVAHDGAVRAEVGASRLLDRLAPPPADDPLLDGLTVLIKTFERPAAARRLVASIRRLYPRLKVVVVDDGRRPEPISGVETIVLPYDSGISAGRNAALERAETPYVLVLDDDAVFYRRTRLAEALRLLEREPEIDVMGGQLVDLPLLTQRPPAVIAGSIFATAAEPVRPPGSAVGGLRVLEKVPNFFLARRERLRLVGWDESLKLMEHADFFTRAVGVLTTVFNPRLKCLHARTPFDDAYMAKRLDLAEYRRILDARYGRRGS